MRRLWALILAAAAATVAVVGCGANAENVALIDGYAISRSEYDHYALVFTAPDGTLTVSSEDVLLSLVNQAVVLAEANRRGIVVADDQIAAAVSESAAIAASSLPGGGDDPAYRDRVRMFLLFKLVKEQVVGQIDISHELIEAEYLRDPSLQEVGLVEATPVLREHLVIRESDRRWIAWLSSQRACAHIRVLDGSFNLPSSTPAPECAGAGDE